MANVLGTRYAFPQGFVCVSSHCRQLVADSSHGHDPLGNLRVAFDLAPEIRDVDVAGALVAHVAALPELLHQLAPAEHTIRVRRHEGKQRELGAREATGLAVDGHSVCVGVELEPAHAQPSRGSGSVELATSKQSPDPAHEL